MRFAINFGGESFSPHSHRLSMPSLRMVRWLLKVYLLQSTLVVTVVVGQSEGRTSGILQNLLRAPCSLLHRTEVHLRFSQGWPTWPKGRFLDFMWHGSRWWKYMKLREVCSFWWSGVLFRFCRSSGMSSRRDFFPQQQMRKFRTLFPTAVCLLACWVSVSRFGSGAASSKTGTEPWNDRTLETWNPWAHLETLQPWNLNVNLSTEQSIHNRKGFGLCSKNTMEYHYHHYLKFFPDSWKLWGLSQQRPWGTLVQSSRKVPRGSEVPSSKWSISEVPRFQVKGFKWRFQATKGRRFRGSK